MKGWKTKAPKLLNKRPGKEILLRSNDKNPTHLLLATLIFILALGSIISAFAFVWIKYPQLLYLYRDGEYNLWISMQTGTWATPLDLTSINPLQGMVSMLVTINPYFDPGQWIFFSAFPQSIKIITSYAIYTLEVLLSTLALGVTLGFPRLYSFIASVWTALLLFPPFNFFFGLGGWFAGAPMFAHTLALTNLCLIICFKLGSLPHQTKYDMFFKNFIFIAALITLIIIILIAAPFYNAGLLPGISFLLVCIILCSYTLEQFCWRILAGLALIATFYALGLAEFYMSVKAYSARFVEMQSFVAINWQNITNSFSPQNIARTKEMLCAYGVHCPAFPGWPISINTAWVNSTIIVGGILVWLTMPRPTARLGAFISIGWTILLLAAALVSLGIISFVISLSWFYLMLYSLCALFSLYTFFLPFKIINDRLRLSINSILTSLMSLIITIVIASWLVFSFHTQPSKIHNLSSNITELQAPMLPDRHPSTPIIQLLQKEIALYPDEQFRGSAATIYGTSEGTLRKAPNVTHTKSVEAGQFEEFLTAAAASGSTHDLLDLWAWNIPTLSEYGQGVSPPLVYYISNFLSLPNDAIEAHFVFPHKPNIDILRALGVRFVVIDKPLLGREVALRQKINAGTSSTLYLYELFNPNLGNYSPTKLIPLTDAAQFKQKIISNPNIFENEAYIDTVFPINLTKASDAKLFFKKGGVHITAKSNGTSALLLPIQYSHCYKAVGSSNIKTMRANIIHTLIIFSGNLDTDLRWEFRWVHSKCRQQDLEDIKKLML